MARRVHVSAPCSTASTLLHLLQRQAGGGGGGRAPRPQLHHQPVAAARLRHRGAPTCLRPRIAFSTWAAETAPKWVRNLILSTTIQSAPRLVVPTQQQLMPPHPKTREPWEPVGVEGGGGAAEAAGCPRRGGLHADDGHARAGGARGDQQRRHRVGAPRVRADVTYPHASDGPPSSPALR